MTGVTNTVTTTLFADVIWPNKVKNKTDFVNSDSCNPELGGHGKCTIFRVTVYLFELALDTVTVE